MATICPLFSGSSGNSIYIGDGQDAMLIDAGRSAKQIEAILNGNNLNPQKINSILVTHEHRDHVSGLRVFAKKYSASIYGSNGTISALIDKKIIEKNMNCYKICEKTELRGSYIETFETSHDCIQSYGYVIKLKSNGLKIAVCTDLGFVSESVLESISGSDVVFIESNHDTDMLWNGSYPYVLKQRIFSDKGHLSNDSCAEILPKLVKKGAVKIILCHLSSENNTPKAAYFSAITNLKINNLEHRKDFKLYVAPKENLEKFKIIM
ncbi:MAG: MBL fold metallo-hydrolase [Oscillospiraceae bacterium]|nr:MBL fold metallo-hydrolase [Oscillospiraceae bacterium]